jgi:hypothetical protein
MSVDPYSRLYWRLSDEFPEVWDDPKVLGTYVQLLIAADAMWPSRPHVPAGVDTTPLTDSGLVVMDGQRYAIRGLDKERKKRQKAGRTGAAARWSDHDGTPDRIADRITDGSAFGMPSRAKPSQDKPSQDKTRQAARATKSQKKGELTHISETLSGGAK